ncbi:MAG: restriction endonuclease subunit S, partial [Flavobacteriales bacterium]|nr:restriction endonuclease subunit S [Flavobacteriales bacterium]
MAKHERYSTYKDSASHWFGEIPSHWDLKPLKYLASINDEKLADSTDRDEVIEYVDIGNVTLQQGICGSETLSFEKAPSRARRIVRDGDSIVSTVRTYLKAIAPIKQPPPNLIVSTGFAVIRPRALDPGYLSYHLQSSNFVEDVVSRSVGVSYPAINPTEIAEIELLQPLLEEQQAISAWLDERTARIDTLIAKKQRLIELLQEKRQAIISKAVTRGLDPHVKLKDSGIQWLGEVPEHW